MKSLFITLLSILFAISLAACSPEEGTQDKKAPEETNEEQQSDNNQETDEEQDTEENQDPEKDEDTEEGQANDRPESKTDKISLEGMEEEFTFTLFEDNALKFSTYIVEDMIAESLSSEEGDAMVAYANFGGTQTDEAVVQIFSPNESIATLEELKALSLEIFEEYGYDVIKRDDTNNSKMVQWAEEEYSLVKENEMGFTILGTLSLFEREGKPYQITVQYPEDFEEGFVPRVTKMFEDLVWYDQK